MPDFEIVLDFDSIHLFGEVSQRAPELFEANMEAAGMDIGDVLQEDMSQPGLPVTYPIWWDSEQQRKAYFASDGFGGGVPSVRSGELESSWHARVELIDGNRMRAGAWSDKDYAKWVQDADWQSRIHEGRWKTIQQELNERTQYMIDQLHEAALATLDQMAQMMTQTK